MALRTATLRLFSRFLSLALQFIQFILKDALQEARFKGILLWHGTIFVLFVRFPPLLCKSWVPSSSVSKLSWQVADGTRFILPWSAARQVPPFYKLGIVDHPKAAEVILVPHETLVQRQIRADCVLQMSSGRCRTGKEREKEGKISSSWQVGNLVVWLVVVVEEGAIVMDICTHLVRPNKPIIQAANFCLQSALE